MATNGEPLDHLAQTVADVCRLMAADAEIRSIHVVMNRRPGYWELLRYRQHAEACGLTLTVLGSGGVVLRPRTAPGRAAEPADAEQERRVS